MLEQNNKSHPGFAAVLSFIFNGLGQLYNGQIFKGLLIIFLAAISTSVLIISSILIAFWLLGKNISYKIFISGIVLFVSNLIFIGILGIYSIIDAYQTAAKR